MVKGLFKGTKSSEMRMVNSGIELAGAVIIFALAGYGMDRWFDTSPWWTLILSMLAVVGGTYNLIKEGFKQFKEDDEPGSKPGK